MRLALVRKRLAKGPDWECKSAWAAGSAPASKVSRRRRASAAAWPCQPRRKVEGPSSCTTGALSRHAGGAQSEWPRAARAAAAAAKQAGCGSGLSRRSRNSCATRGKRRLKTAKQSAQEAQKAGTELRTAEARPSKGQGQLGNVTGMSRQVACAKQGRKGRQHG